MKLSEVTDARSPVTTPGVTRLPNLKALTSVRFFAAFYVAIYHFVRPFSQWGHLSPIMGTGYIGVSFFFLLSGFILTYSHAEEYERKRGHASKFWVARFARIYPVYLLSLLAAAYVYRAQFHQRIHIVAYLADVFMLQSWSTHTVLFFNGPAWSLSCEAFFYLVFPFVLLRLRPSTTTQALFSLASTLLLTLAVPLICLHLYPAATWTESAAPGTPGGFLTFAIRRHPLTALPEFLFGISLGWFYLRFGLTNRLAATLAAASSASLLILLALSDHLPFLLLNNGLLVPVFAMLILGLSKPNPLTRFLSQPLLVLLGEASFSLYLFHVLISDWLAEDFGIGESISTALLKLLIVIPLSVVLHLFVERPSRRIILDWWRKRHPAELVAA